MRFKKVLLVSPRFYKGRNRLAHFPLTGLGYIAEALTNAGIEVEVLDMNLRYTFLEFERRVYRFKPDIVGFTAMTLGYKEFYRLIDRIKQLHPQLKIVLGGAHLSSVREKVLYDCQGIDYGIIFEGDISMVQLCLGEDFKNIQGFIYRDNGKIIVNKFEHYIDDLDKVPFPKYESFELNKYPLRQMPILTSRGCPYECIYCSTSIGKKFRARSALSIMDEIEYWHNRGYREFFILDDNFTLIYNRVEQLCMLLCRKNLKDLRINLVGGVRADRVDQKLLKAMKEVGVSYLAFGVESASDKVLQNIKKGEGIAIIEKSIKEACELGFIVDLFLIFGSPGETMEDLQLSFSLAQRYPVRRAVFYNLLPLPSTELLTWLNKKNYLIRPIEDILNNASYYKNQTCFFTPEMSVADRRKAFRLAQKVSLRVRRRFVERGIKGPAFLRKAFSALYTLPIIEDAVNNNRLMLLSKEKIKKIFMNKL